jgi:hypothetical protein
MHVLYQFIPIITIIVYMHYDNLFVKFVRSSLGRFFTVFIIILYTAYNKYLGAIIGLLVIIFYQSTDPFIETMASMPPITTFVANTSTFTPFSYPPPPPLQTRDMVLPTQEPFDGWIPYQKSTLFFK